VSALGELLRRARGEHLATVERPAPRVRVIDGGKATPPSTPEERWAAWVLDGRPMPRREAARLVRACPFGVDRAEAVVGALGLGEALAEVRAALRLDRRARHEACEEHERGEDCRACGHVARPIGRDAALRHRAAAIVITVAGGLDALGRWLAEPLPRAQARDLSLWRRERRRERRVGRQS